MENDLSGKNNSKEEGGIISLLSEKADFTPKLIKTGFLKKQDMLK